MEILKYGLMVGITALGGTYFGLVDGSETKALIEERQFDQADISRMNVCKRALIKASVYFDESTDADGCACIVATIKQEIPEPMRDLAHALDALDSYSVGAGFTEIQYANALEDIGLEFNQSAQDVQLLKDQVNGLINACAVQS